MKRLILIQNDVAGTGKSTLTRCLARYLSMHGVAHQIAHLADEEIPLADAVHFETETLTPGILLNFIDQSPLSIIEIESGLGEFFGHFYQGYDIENILSETGCQLSVLVPVGSEPETFESVVRAAEVYSDSAEYTIAHTVTSTYDVASEVWDHSYAARVMDMFEAVELHLPEIGFQLEMELRAQHMDLASAMASPDAEQVFGVDFQQWMFRCLSQVESTRQYLFGDSFVPTSTPAPLRLTRSRKNSSKTRRVER